MNEKRLETELAQFSLQLESSIHKHFRNNDDSGKNPGTNMAINSRLDDNHLASEEGVSEPSIVTKNVKRKEFREREKWANKIEFIFASLTYCVGLGNVFRFPYLCYKNGGGAFLVPYFVFLIFGAIPILFIEVGIGQYFRSGGLTVWGQICPLFTGIGYGTVAVSFIVNSYYIIVLSWALLYFFNSFSWTLPWSTCDNEWNTANCWSPFTHNGTRSPQGAVNSVTEFWERKVLQVSPGIDHPDGLQWKLVGTLTLAWVIVFFCVWKGVKSTGKAVYVTALFPYLIITALLIRGVTLPGAIDGIKFFILPDFDKVWNIQVWMDAGTQILLSSAIAVGCMASLGSYNEFNNNFYHQLFFLSCMNSATSIYAGFAIFSVLGYMAFEQGMTVPEVAESGPGLAFIAYPRAVAAMPFAPLWAVLFFTMILTLGLGTEFVGIEGFVTAMVDLFPNYLRVGRRREWFILGTCLVSFTIGLSMITRGGVYVFQLFDFYGCNGMVLIYGFFEVAVIGWIYGADRFTKNIETMVGFKILPYFKFCWKYTAPFITTATLIAYIIMHEPIKYNGTYEYPTWGIGFGWCLALSSILILPTSIIVIWTTSKGSFLEKWRTLTTPIEPEHVLKSREFNNNKLLNFVVSN